MASDVTQWVKKCITCQKTNARALKQIMSPLPFSRTSKTDPFYYTALDHTGSFEIRESSYTDNMVKSYVIVFICMTTKSIFLELVENHTSDQFLMALQRLSAVHGMPQHLYSDSHATYQACEQTITDAIHKAKLQTEHDPIYTSQNFKWTYSTPMDSATGGFHEAAVKSIKKPLMKILPNSRLTYVELQTLLKNIQRYINDRPLISSEENTFEVLTPSMLTNGRKLNRAPEFDENDFPPHKVELRENWQHRTAVQQQVWNAWQKHYLPSLQQRGKWFGDSPNIKVGDLVLVETHLIKRHQWPLARVENIKMGRDKKIRSVGLRFADDVRTDKRKSILTRSIRQLYPLEAALQRISSIEPVAAPKKQE